MGNAQSDEGEAEAYRIIKYIPGVNIGYSAARACVYKGRADNESNPEEQRRLQLEAEKSGVGVGVGALETAAWVVPGGKVVQIAAYGTAAAAGGYGFEKAEEALEKRDKERNS